MYTFEFVPDETRALKGLEVTRGSTATHAFGTCDEFVAMMRSQIWTWAKLDLGERVQLKPEAVQGRPPSDRYLAGMFMSMSVLGSLFGLIGRWLKVEKE